MKDAPAHAPASAAAPAERVRVEPPGRLPAPDLRELWRYRELVWLLALRDVRVRYKQAALGVAWALIQPLATLVLFGSLFGLLLGPRGLPTRPGVPYAVSTFCALVPWQLFARALASSGESLVANHALITKVYFPRLAAPLASVAASLVDFALAFAVLLAMLAIHGISPGPACLALPLFTLLAVASALAVSLWLSALNALARDVRHALPFLAQLWMFATPVVYTAESVLGGRPPAWKILYGLNPMTGVVEGFRWALLGGSAPPWDLLAASSLGVSALLLGGLFFFQRLERSFADLV
jgi:lipopolysaccharide transport system permease protein